MLISFRSIMAGGVCVGGGGGGGGGEGGVRESAQPS